MTAGLAALVVVTGSAQAQSPALRVVIEAPAHVEVGDAFTISVLYSADAGALADNPELEAGLYADSACPPAGVSPLVDLTPSFPLPFASQEQRVQDRAGARTPIGPYVVCAYTETTTSSPVLAAVAAVSIDAIRPSLANPWTIRLSTFSVRSLGPLLVANVSPGDLDFYYGQRGRKRSQFGGNGCHTSWSAVGLTADFGNLGGGGSACGDAGSMNAFTIGGGRFFGLVRTTANLKLGDRVSQIRPRYRHAERHGRRTWWLRSAHSPIAGGFRYAVLTARTKEGRVTAFSGFVGAACE